jgi:CheY-like chemotaxis protein
VRLPAVPAPQAQSAAGEAGRAGSRSVLIVEDNDDARQMLAAALTLCGHHVLAASSGVRGLELAAQAMPEIAVIDVGLPDIDGYEVARRLRAARGGRRMALIALTGYGQPADQARAFDAGFDAHLTKPVSVERLNDTMATLRGALARAAG